MDSEDSCDRAHLLNFNKTNNKINMKRLIIVDDNVQNTTRYFGCGLGQDIYSVSSLETLDELSRKSLLQLTVGDAAMLVGSRAFELLRQYYHFGIRGENYWDCSQLRRLGIEGGAFVKIIHEDDFPDDQTRQFFMSPEFCMKREFPGYKYKIAKSYQESKPLLEYFKNLPVGTDIGFDYETSGMPMEINFLITGAALALAYSNLQASVFFSFQDIRRNNTVEEYEQFKRDFAEILWIHQKNIWVFNIYFETQVTWREFGIDCNFCDASVYNILDGLHSKNYSLKWTAQRLLGGGDMYHLRGTNEGAGIEPWDTDFDKLEDAFDRLYFVNEYVKGKKKPVGKLYKCNEYDYQIQKEWKEINAIFPGYQTEFETLIKENFGNPFLNMPSDILGKYCCLDSFYTVLIHLENRHRYSDLCRETFINNQRVYSTLTRSGLYINDDYRKTYENYCHKMILWGVLYLSSYRCYRKIEKHSKKANNIKKYPKFCQLLLKKNEFCNGDPVAISKNLLAQNVDNSGIYDDGLNQGRLALIYGQEFSKEFIRIVREAMTETKYKGKIDESVARKKKLIGTVAEKLHGILELDKIKLGEKHLELEKLLFYQEAYKDLSKVWLQLSDINNIPDTLIWRGKKYPIYELSQVLSENFYRCSSPIDNVELEQEWIEEFHGETMFVSTIFRDVNKLPGEKKFFKNLGITDIYTGYKHFTEQLSIYWNNGLVWPSNLEMIYSEEVLRLAYDLYNDPKHDYMTGTWGEWNGYDKQADFFPDQTEAEMDLLGKPWNESDLSMDPFLRMRKLLINILLLKKYEKLRGTYLCDTGLFNAGSKYVIDTPSLIPVRDADEFEPGAVKKTFLKYKVMQLETKRSSSGYHTIPSHMDAKACVTCPVLNTPGTRTGKTATILTYFDIN